MQNEVFVAVNGLSRYYGHHCAVKNLNFKVLRGEVVGFLGPNGAGKSTTMNMITGNLAPSAGEITINGIDMLSQPKAAKQHIGYLPEYPPIYKELTVDEYLSFCAEINRIPRKKRQDAISQAKNRCGLTEVGKKLNGNLSKGFQQRVGIAQAVIHSPAVVMLDEPTAGLDPIQIREIGALINELRKDHSIILSSHILSEVQSLCDRVLIINKGELVLDGSVTVLQKPATASLTVAFHQPPDVTALESIEHVHSAHKIDSRRYRLEYEPDFNPATQIVEASVEHQWQLHELIPDTQSLEQVFMELTANDVHASQSHTDSTEEAAKQ